jgi:hypothetical protein
MARIYICLWRDYCRLLLVYKTATTNTDVIDILPVVVSIVVVATITRTPRTTMEHDPCTVDVVCVCLLRLFST